MTQLIQQKCEVYNLTIVCTGNICRSPMGYGYFKEQVKKNNLKINVDSAGVRAVVGRQPVSEAIAAMNEIGIDISEHRGKQLTEEIVVNSDLILTMENHHKQDIVTAFPYSRGKVFLLGEWSNFEIFDPFRKTNDSFLNVREMLELSWNDWVKKL